MVEYVIIGLLLVGIILVIAVRIRLEFIILLHKNLFLALKLDDLRLKLADPRITFTELLVENANLQAEINVGAKRG